ncbi:hypothetical protein K432DRAFT_321727 [Lepidopterella palustris CBS 459.81]|uniref:Uncharacterized protein n=1 Tax=Lepidopterella palustris CBS 459.81 TaxID=1314670 RepID=A0A8E2JID1_9PEZI|nr:hypothetical protein K432DRAFT_321727 [Lepidopterella palustris CBS 459.81]
MSLPMRLKIDIRDKWVKEDTALQKAQKALSELIGYKIQCEPEWPMLWTELQPYFPDTSTFIPSVCSTLVAWCNALTTLLDDDSNSEWTELALEELSKASVLRIRIEVDGTDRPTTKWTSEKSAFTIFLPKSGTHHQSTMAAGFNGDFLACFQPEPVPRIPLASKFEMPDDSWADIETDSAVASGRIEPPKETASSTTAPAKVVVDRLPDASLLERPEYLMLKPPYHLILSAYLKEMTVQCSHPPTLKVIEEYLKRWTKRDNGTVNRPQAVVLTLQESPFGLGLVFDRLHISIEHSRMNYRLGPTMLLSLIEGVLGYTLTYGTGDTWTFRKETEFKS